MFWVHPLGGRRLSFSATLQNLVRIRKSTDASTLFCWTFRPWQLFCLPECPFSRTCCEHLWWGTSDECDPSFCSGGKSAWTPSPLSFWPPDHFRLLLLRLWFGIGSRDRKRQTGVHWQGVLTRPCWLTGCFGQHFGGLWAFVWVLFKPLLPSLWGF